MRKNKRIVIKIGTKVITSKNRTLDEERIGAIVSQISDIRDKGFEVLIVTSGAIGAGMSLLNMKRRPSGLSELQAAAAIGQNHLMRIYSGFFKSRGYLVGQILLTQEDFNDRVRYLNIKHTINTLLDRGVTPIINENDTVATDEIKCGDNDRISSLVADLAGAGMLIILTDVAGLLDESGNVIARVGEISANISGLCGGGSGDLGTGGMAAKLIAARTAARSGVECVIANGKEKAVLTRIVLDREKIGTAFECHKEKFMARKRWIAFSSKAKGLIRIDEGAKNALMKRDKSLLASGITGVGGDFVRGDVVKITDKDGKEIARGVVNYSSTEIGKIKGLKSARFKSILGYSGHDEIIHKDNLVIL